VSASFTDVVFPKGGQYVLVVYGQLPLPAASAAADSSQHLPQQQQQLVAASTLIGVGAQPFKSLAARYNGSRVGRTQVTVHSSPLQQGHTSTFSELILPDGSSSGTNATAAAARGSGRNRNSSLQDAYSVALDLPASCVPGQPATYTWTLRHASNGEPVTDLQMQNGAAMRLVVASADLSHLHLTTGTAQPSSAATRARSSSGGGASAYMRGSRVAAASATVAEAAAAPSATPVNSTVQQQQGGRRLLAPLAAHTALRQLQQTDSGSSDADGSSGSSRVDQFGPSMFAQVALPSYGTYLFAAEVVRGGDELIVIPFYVVCSDDDNHLESAAATPRTNGAAHAMMQQPLRMMAGAVLVLMLQSLVL
jgi:hypothetical protein